MNYNNMPDNNYFGAQQQQNNMYSPSSLNNLAREYVAALRSKPSSAELRQRGEAARLAKPKKIIFKSKPERQDA